MTTEKVTFTQARETLLATLYARALDTRSKRPILGDEYAVDAVRRIDYPFRKTGVRPGNAAGVVIRALQFDVWTRDFLAEHPDATVLHLGCGLDTRVYRIDPGPGVRWYDVDFPDVIELRQRLLPARDGYRMIGASVTDEGWMEEIPVEGPVFVVAEGLTMYLQEEQGRRLLQRITDHFPHGEIAFDAFSRLGIRSQKINKAVQNAGATLYWGIDDPHELERWNPRLECAEVKSYRDVAGADRLSPVYRTLLSLFSLVPAFRKMAVFVRLRFPHA